MIVLLTYHIKHLQFVCVCLCATTVIILQNVRSNIVVVTFGPNLLNRVDIIQRFIWDELEIRHSVFLSSTWFLVLCRHPTNQTPNTNNFT